MHALIIVPCTNRKRLPIEGSLRARTLPKGTAENIAHDWGHRLKDAPRRCAAKDLYCGRAFREAFSGASVLAGELYILSAGLGLVSAEDQVPSYSLTVATGSEDSISKRIEGQTWNPNDWWRALEECRGIKTGVMDLISTHNASVVLMALSSNYAKMIHDHLERLEPSKLKGLRLFGLGLEPYLPAKLRPNLMPYDQRLDGPDSNSPGTRSDFSSRALHHFSMALKHGVIEGQDSMRDAAVIRQHLADWRWPSIPSRTPQSDQEIVAFIERHWEKFGGRSGRMLHFLRDSGLACEQGRFRDLFRLALGRQPQQEPAP